MTSGFEARAGFAWYVGKQNDDNSLDAVPPYLSQLPATAAGRCRYAAHLAFVPVGERALTVVYYVDPEYRHMYAQPHPDSAEFRMVNWGQAHPAQRGFEDARAFVRALFRLPSAKPSRHHEAWWRRYAAGEMPQLWPWPLDIPNDPAVAYRGAGWKDFRDWLVTPPRKTRKKKKGSGHVKAVPT